MIATMRDGIPTAMPIISSVPKLDFPLFPDESVGGSFGLNTMNVVVVDVLDDDLGGTEEWLSSDVTEAVVDSDVDDESRSLFIVVAAVKLSEVGIGSEDEMVLLLSKRGKPVLANLIRMHTHSTN